MSSKFRKILDKLITLETVSKRLKKIKWKL